MDLNFVKLRRKINYFKSLTQYIIKSIFVRLKKIGECSVVDYSVRKGTYCNDLDEVAFLGNIADKSLSDTVNLIMKINEIANEPDIILYYSEGIYNNDLLKQCDLSLNAYNVAENEYTVIKSRNLRIGVAVFNLEDNKSINRWKTMILQKRLILQKKHVNFLVAYVKDSRKRRYNSGQIKRLIGTWGFDCVVGIDKNVKGRRNLRSIVFSETRILYSLGQLGRVGTIPNNNLGKLLLNSGVIYKASLQIERKKAIVIREGYIPICIYHVNNEIKHLKEIRKGRWINNKEEKQYLRLEKIMRGFRNWRELITLKDIFEVLGENIPPKYKNIERHTVNQICARTYELSPGNVFFFRRAFKDKNDGKGEIEILRNKLILRAFTRKSLFVFSYKKLPSFIPHVVINNPTEAHIKVMAWYREKFISARYIGVTGSIGKTSTKDMLYYVLNHQYVTGRSIRNHNVQVHIGISEQRISSNTDIFVQEIGGGRPGGASRHSRMILPEAAIITNIGTAHIGNYISQDELMKNKLGIIDGMKENGKLFLNGDDPLLINAKVDYPISYFALNNHNADCYATNVKEMNGKTYFDIVYEGKTYSAIINVLGKHNVLNAVCSFSVAKYIGMDTDKIIEGLLDFKTAGTRQNLIRVGGFSIFVDCYNASVASISSSLSILKRLNPKYGGKRVAVIGDVTGMGEQQQNMNESIARIIESQNVDQVIVYGNNAEDICALIKKEKLNVKAIKDRKTLEKWIERNLSKEDVLLVKGSAKLKLDESLDTLFGTNLSDQGLIDSAHYSLFRKNKASYRVFENYISLYKYYGLQNKMVVPNTIFNKKVKKITLKAFSNNRYLESIRVGKNVIHIGSYAFAGCVNLEKIEFKGVIKFIGRSAFQNCSKLKRIVFSDGLIHIGPDAFAKCKSLDEIVLPKSVGHISKNAFRDCKAKIVYF